MKRGNMGNKIIGTVSVLLMISGCGSDTSEDDATAAGGGAAEITLIGTKWEWVGTVTPVERVEVTAPERYSITLNDDGSLTAQLDCNNGRSTYEIMENRIEFGIFIATRMACPEDTQDFVFARQLEEVSTFFMQDGQLFLEMPFDSGTMRFRPSIDPN